jgi:malonyl-CoA O-methyltransferase
MLDKRRIRRSFDRAADRYDEYAVLQYDIAGRLLERLDGSNVGTPRRILDLGCGTGFVARALAQRYRGARVLGVDLSPAMVQQANARRGWWSRCHYVCADAERLPLATNSMDMVVSNLALQWCDAATAFAEVARVLRPGGGFLFSTFGPDTLRELRAAWARVNSETHVHGFVDMHELGDLLLGQGFVDPVMDMDMLSVDYASVDAVMADLRGIGAHNVAAPRNAGLTGKQAFAGFRRAYEDMAVNGRIPASYEVVFGYGRAPTMTHVGMPEGSVAVPVSEIRRR